MVDCGDPGQLTNGLRKDKNVTTYNSMVHYFCNPEYILSGSRERVCQADGKWSGTQPKCTSKNSFFIFIPFLISNALKHL